MLHRIICSKRIAVSLVALTALFSTVAHAQTSKASVPKTPGATATKTQLAAGYARLPLAFEPNVGQVVDRRVRFLTHTARGTLFLTDTEAVLTLPCAEAKTEPTKEPPYLDPKHRQDREKPRAGKYAVVRMKLMGAQKPVATLGLAPLPGIVNYFRGNDPKQWFTHIPTYRQAKFPGVYKGVDMVYYGSQSGKLEYDFVVKPGADPKSIHLAFFGTTGARVTAGGELRLQTAAGEVRWQRPMTYQMIGGHREAVACAYELNREGGQATVGFRLARYDTSCPVVIDPVLQYSTLLGGSGYYGDSANAIAVDGEGNATLAGYTSSSDFPVTAGAFQTRIDGNNAFISKLNATGSALIYSTFLGGPSYGGSEEGAAYGVAVDSAGNAYVTGYTLSSDFPVTAGAFQTTIGDRGDNYKPFVTKLNATGSALIYSTFLGGTGGDVANGIAVDSAGNAYVTGYTHSSDFPVTAGAFQTTFDSLSTGSNAFVSKLNATGSALIYSTFLGGSGSDQASAIKIDSTGNAYLAGSTSSTDFPTKGAFQKTLKTSVNGGANAFVTKLNAMGSALIYSTFLGGTGSDQANAITIDKADNTYVAGYATSSDFPVTKGAYQAKNGGANAFITKLDSKGSALVYSTFLGGTKDDEANGIAVDGAGNATLAGSADSADFPVTKGAFQTTNNGANAFITKLNSKGSALIYSTFLGGSGRFGDAAHAIAVDGSDNVYTAGDTSSTDFPVTSGAFQTINIEAVYGNNAFVSKFAFETAIMPFTLTASPDAAVGGATVSGTIKFNAPTPAGGITLSITSPSDLVVLSPTLIVPAGVKTASFNIGTKVVSADTLVPITASYGTNSATADLTLAPVQDPVVSRLTLSPTTVKGGVQNSVGTVTLTGAAPSSGVTVNLISSNANTATVAATVSILGGQTSVQFRVKSQKVTARQTALVSAATQGSPVSQSATLTITP